MFYVLNDKKEIAIYDTDRERLANTLLFKPNGLEASENDILETEDEIVTLSDGTIDFKSKVEEQ